MCVPVSDINIGVVLSDLLGTDNVPKVFRRKVAQCHGIEFLH